jgi:hypothetical protein
MYEYHARVLCRSAGRLFVFPNGLQDSHIHTGNHIISFMPEYVQKTVLIVSQITTIASCAARTPAPVAIILPECSTFFLAVLWMFSLAVR